jgi:4-carboxymuconolactone decarboxylase
MAQKKPTVYEFIPKLGQLRDDVLFGDVWEHPDLSKRDRSLITVAMLAALYRTDEMRGHMQRALDNGVTETELKGLITHVAFYAGWPCAVNAGRIAIEVFGPKGQRERADTPAVECAPAQLTLVGGRLDISRNDPLAEDAGLM